MAEDFNQLVEEELYESFSTASYMDVRELRSLYYGRIDILISFSNESYLENEGSRDLPDGYLCYQLEDVVGRRVSSSRFYAHVLRRKKEREGIIEDIRNYPVTRLNEDIQKIKTFNNTINEFELDEAIHRITHNPRISLNFQKLWLILDAAYRGFEDKPYRWKEALLDLGIRSITDPQGLLIGRRSTMVFDDSFLEPIDIVPVQMYRADPRRRVRDDVDRIVRRLSVRRNRIAKGVLNRSRGSSKTLQKNVIQRLI